MKVLIIGGTGYVGKAICKNFASKEYSVTATTRTENKFSELKDLGVSPIVFDMNDFKEYKSILLEQDVIIQAAYDYSVSKDVGLNRDKKFVANLIDFLRTAKNKPHVIYTSNGFLGGGTLENPITETSVIKPNDYDASRIEQENQLLELLNEEIKVSVVRVGMVYGGREATLSEFYNLGKKGEKLPIINEGNNHWSMIDITKLAELYSNIIENCVTGIFHGVDNKLPTFKEIVSRIAEEYKTGTKSITLEEGRKLWGGFADTLARDVIVKSQRVL